MNNEPRRDRHDLDEAIDRVVRDMTRVEVNDDAVARVMARVRGARSPRKKVGGFRIWSPRANWSFAATAAALVILAVVGSFFRPMPSRGGDANRGEVARATPGTPATLPVPQPSTTASAPPQVAGVDRHVPAIASAVARSGVRPGNAAGATTRAMSIVEPANADAASIEAGNVEAANAEAGDEFHSDLSPREGDLAMSGIVPAPLAESPALTVEPLGMRELTVDSIDPSPITVPSPVGPQR